MAATCVIYRLRWHDGGKLGNKIFNIRKLGKLKWCEGVRGKSIELDLVNVMKGERKLHNSLFVVDEGKVEKSRKTRKAHKYLKTLLIESFLLSAVEGRNWGSCRMSTDISASNYGVMICMRRLLPGIFHSINISARFSPLRSVCLLQTEDIDNKRVENSLLNRSSTKDFPSSLL